MFGIATILYLFIIFVFVGGMFVVVYHLLTFRLNKMLAWFMTTLLIIGGLIFLGINIFYFSKIDWQALFSQNNLL